MKPHELYARVEALERESRDLRQRVEALEKVRLDAMDDYMDQLFPLAIPKIEQFLTKSGYAPRGKKSATTE